MKRETLRLLNGAIANPLARSVLLHADAVDILATDAENKRLRGALRDMAESAPLGLDAADLRRLARAALKPRKAGR